MINPFGAPIGWERLRQRLCNFVSGQEAFDPLGGQSYAIAALAVTSRRGYNSRHP